MNKNNLGIALVVLGIFSVSVFSQPPNPAVRLEAGLAKEEVDGDLKAAIERSTRRLQMTSRLGATYEPRRCYGSLAVMRSWVGKPSRCMSR